MRLRRHGANYSDESQRDRELEQVEQAVRRALGSYSLRDLAADVDWDALPQPVAERRARLVLAERFAERGLPNLAAELRDEAAEEPATRRPRQPRAHRADVVRLQRPGRRHRACRASPAARWPPAAGT